MEGLQLKGAFGWLAAALVLLAAIYDFPVSSTLALLLGYLALLFAKSA